MLNLVLLSTLMILIGYSSYASVTIRAAANPPMNSNNPSNPFALYSLLNRDQYGDKPLLYGPQFSAPTSGYKYKDVRYLDDDGKYKTVSIISGYEHPDEFMHLFPRMWNYAASKESYNHGAPTAPGPITNGMKTAKSSATRRDARTRSKCSISDAGRFGTTVRATNRW